jgi:hypothetical protein
MGAKAVPALMRALDDDEHGWQPASILAKIGPPAANRAATVLLRHARNDRTTPRVDDTRAHWSARALATLGRLDEVAGLVDRKRSAYAGICGLVAGRPASYPYLERVLDRKNSKLSRMIADELTPGGAAYKKRPADFDTIVRATASPHVVIRTDSALALCGRGIAMSDRPRAVDVLLGLLEDRSSEVRRVATLSLGWSATFARPHLARIRAMATDPSAGVRDAVKIALHEIG